MQLYKLSKQFQDVQDLAEEMDVGDTLDAISMEFDKKAKGIGFVFKNLEGQEKLIGDEIKRLQERKRVLGNNKERIKDYLRENMGACGKTKIDCGLFKISRIAGRKEVVVDDQGSIPKDFIKTVELVDKTALLKALNDGPVEGAHIGESKESIRIS